VYIRAAENLFINQKNFFSFSGDPSMRLLDVKVVKAVQLGRIPYTPNDIWSGIFSTTFSHIKIKIKKA
jgi:hypothetical protein